MHSIVAGKLGQKKEEGNEQAPAVLLKSRQSLVVTTTIFLPVRPTVSCAFDGQCVAATARRAVRTQQRGSQHVARACTQLRRVVSAHRGVQSQQTHRMATSGVEDVRVGSGAFARRM